MSEEGTHSFTLVALYSCVFWERETTTYVKLSIIAAAGAFSTTS